MKKIRSIFLLISCVLFMQTLVYAQDILPVASAQTLKAFESSVTYVVLEQDMISDYNIAIEAAMAEQWHVTKYEIISAGEFKSMRKDKTKSFLYINPVFFEKDKTQTEYLYLFLSMGDPSGRTDRMDDLCAIPLAVRNTRQDAYVYKLGLMLNFVQSHLAVSKQIPSGTDDKAMLKYYEDNKPDLSRYKLLLLKEELEPEIRSESAVREIYPYPFEFVSKDKIRETIANYTENTLILHLVKAGENRYCVKFIADAATGRLVFFDYHKTTDKTASVLLKKDLKKLAK